MHIAGKTVAVTGGASGIGYAIAQQFAAAGAKVAVGDVDASGPDTIALDIADAGSFRAFLDEAEARHGPLDVLVNNAGVDWVGPFHEEPDDVSRREIAINLTGTLLGTRLALQRMLPRRSGHIVNVASGVGRVPLPGSATYSATKHGVVGLTESLRLEYRDSGVGFSLIQPSQVTTAMMDGQARPRLMAQITPDAVAAAVVDAVREDRFEVWVPGSQGVALKLSGLLPRRARERVMLAIGLGRLASDADFAARREYHDRAFGGPHPD